MTDLQIGYMYTLISVARIRRDIARSFAELNNLEEMKTYLLSNAPTRCHCVNNEDLCGRCNTLELVNKF